MDVDKKYQKLVSNYEEHCRRVAQISVRDSSESQVDRTKRINALESNYIDWFEYYFPNFAKCPCAWFHGDFANRMIRSIEIFELLEVYRSGAKSVHADMGVPLYLYYTGKLRFMLLIGETEAKSRRLLSSLQAQIQHNKRLFGDYGPRYKQGDWAEGDFATSDTARFMSLGFGQDARGVRQDAQRPDYIVVDDVDNKRHVNNDRLMRERVEWIFEELIGCFDERDGATKRFVFANNNFHKNGITNRLKIQFQALIQKAKDRHEPVRYHVLTVKAVRDINTFFPEWPEKTSSEYWRQKFANTPYRSFMREYMHTHIEDGHVFRMDDMQWKPMLPLKEYEAICMYGDLSYKAAACFKGMVLIGRKGKEFHVIHVFLRQSSRPTLAKWLYDLYEDFHLDRAPRIKYWIEGLFSMDEFVNDFDDEGEARGYYIPVKADKRPKGDKYDRIEATQSFFERHNVFFSIDEIKLADQIELIDQYLSFEKGGQAAVDGPDAAEGAFSKLNVVVRKQNAQYRVGKRSNQRF